MHLLILFGFHFCSLYGSSCTMSFCLIIYQYTRLFPFQKKKKKCKKKGVLLQLDLEKAFDEVDWIFLDAI